MVLVDSTPKNYKRKFLPTMPTYFQEAYKKQFTLEGTYDEFMTSLNQANQQQEQEHPGTIPLFVLSSGKKDHYSKESQKLWHEMQEELLQLSNQSELIIAHHSSHYIQKDEPLKIVEALYTMLQHI